VVVSIGAADEYYIGACTGRPLEEFIAVATVSKQQQQHPLQRLLRFRIVIFGTAVSFVFHVGWQFEGHESVVPGKAQTSIEGGNVIVNRERRRSRHCGRDTSSIPTWRLPPKCVVGAFGVDYECPRENLLERCDQGGERNVYFFGVGGGQFCEWWERRRGCLMGHEKLFAEVECCL